MLCTLDATSQKNSEVWRIWPHWTMFSMIIMKSIVCYRHQCNLFFVDLKEGKSARMSILSMNFCYFKIHCYKKESPIRISNSISILLIFSQRFNFSMTETERILHFMLVSWKRGLTPWTMNSGQNQSVWRLKRSKITQLLFLRTYFSP